MKEQSASRAQEAVIVTALPEEYRAVRARLRNLREETHPQRTVYERGEFRSGTHAWDIAIVEVGPGNTAAAVEAERAVQYFQPDVILFVGVAGGIKDVVLGDVVAATKVYGYESGKDEETFKTRPDVMRSTYGLEQRARTVARNNKWLQRIKKSLSSQPHAFVGPIAAGAKVVASTSSATYRFLREHYNDALAVEMEGLGFLQAAHANQNIEALVVRGISDLIDDKGIADAHGSHDIAAANASAFAFEVLANFDLQAKQVPEGRSQVSSTPATSKLSMRWNRELQLHPSEGSLLNWRTRLSDFVGFDDQMDELREWAMSPPQVSLKFIVGEGGTGKTRSAAEFARSLQRQDKWAAGFVDLRKPQSYDLSKKGNLLVVDYPEEQQSAVEELLKDLAGLGSDCPRLRVLLLTRRSIEHWYDLIVDSKANAVVDMKPVMVKGLSPEDAYKAFCSAQERAAKHRKTTPVPVSEEQLVDWLKLTPENDRALFVVAAAVHSAVRPNDLVVQYSGSEVVQSIADREVAGLRNMAKGAGLKDHYVLARVLAVAAVAGSITETAVVKMGQVSPQVFGLQEGEDIRKALRLITAEPERLILAPKPDILAAAMAVRILREMPDTAPELIWLGLEPDLSNGLNRIARLTYDAEIVLGMHRHRISDWLAEAVQGRKKRCEMLDRHFSEGPLPIGWINAAVAMSRTLLDSVVTEEWRAVALHNLSAHLSTTGDNVRALKASHEAVTVLRRLAEDQPAFEPLLGMSLNNLSNCLSDAGDQAGALDTILEAVDVYGRLAKAQPARYEPGLGISLNNLSNCLSDSGDHAGALAAIREAVDVCRRLAAAQPAHYGYELAGNLNTLSARLSDGGDKAGALDAIRDCVEICRRLTAAEPARYESSLALGLNNLSLRLNAAGDRTGALDAILEAVELYRRLAKAQPAKYEPNLAASLFNLSPHLWAADDTAGALAAIQESVDVYRRLAATRLARYEPDLARSLGFLGLILKGSGQQDTGNAALEEAAGLLRPYAEQWPKSRHVELLRDIESLLES